MPTSSTIPLRVQRGLDRGEKVVVWVKAARRGVGESQRPRSVAAWLAMWAAPLVAKPIARAASGASCPEHCYLVATDRRLLILGMSRWASDVGLDHSVVLSHVRGARMCPPSGTQAFACISVSDHRDIDVEVPLGESAALQALIAVVRSGAGIASTPPVGGRSLTV